MNITVGRTVMYVLSRTDVSDINNGRQGGRDDYFGNGVKAGDIFPAVAVKVHDGPDNSNSANFQVLLDGNDTYWAEKRLPDREKGHGTWHWPIY